MPRGVYKRKDAREQQKETLYPRHVLIIQLLSSIQAQLDLLKDLING
jgi:hypothetical protein